jgi:site-specific DNA-methyltransferase (adenine-specific)
MPLYPLPSAVVDQDTVDQDIVLYHQDVLETIRSVRDEVQATVLDPWYNRGTGGTRDDYIPWLVQIIEASFVVSQHVFVWGFPEIVHSILDYLPDGTEMVAWLTWYYKNCPSVIRGWRSSQQTCIHLARVGATVYPIHFLNEVQNEKLEQGKLRYIPGPSSVMEVPLNIGFIGKKEQTDHPAQKPLAVIEPLIRMATKPGDIVLDPMCGSGTTGEACRNLSRKAILGDSSLEYIKIIEKRLGIMRTKDYLSPK